MIGVDSRPADQIEARLRESGRVLARLVALARRRLNRPEEAAVYAQAAAHYAWLRHPGRFADRELEHVVQSLAAAGPQSADATEEAEAAPRSVLHVVSQAYAWGGHTRLCWRWIENDSARRHSVALTQQGREPAPARLQEAVSERGGELADLSLAGEPLLARASRLRTMAAGHDAVVLHVHPYDIVSAVAFAKPGPVPVLFLAHADHVFWLGTGSADLFIHLREAGADLASARRGIPAASSTVLPIPLDRHPAGGGLRERTRGELGISDEQTLLLTSASAYKYEGSSRTAFLDTVAPALERVPGAKLLAVGPGDEGRWAAARAATSGRIKALGPRADLPALLDAADVYIDSFPFTSHTAVLEAAQAGLPVVRLAPAGPGLELFEPRSTSIEHLVVSADGREAFAEALRELVEDPAARAERGGRMREAVMASHLGEGWLRRVEAIYEAGANASGRARQVASGADAIDPLEPLDRALCELNARTGSRSVPLAVARLHSGQMRRGARRMLWTFALADVLAGSARGLGLGQLRQRRARVHE